MRDEKGANVMPTGYTAALAEGKEQTFEEFVWSCARGFGALILMRDDPQDAPIPERFEPSQCYAEWQAEQEKRLEWLLSLAGSQVAGEAQKAYDAALMRWQERCRETEAQAARYRAMMARVEAWEPPTPEHHGLKRFMLSQLRESLEHDCRAWNEPRRPSALEWWEGEVSDARRLIERYREGQAEEEARTEDRNQWLAALRESVPVPAALQADR